MNNIKLNINTNSLDDAVKPFFKQLNIDPIEFIYDEKTNRYISKESFSYDDNDPEAYYVVIKMNNNCGTVVIGTSDGIKFNEREFLGQITYNKGKWLTAL